MAYGVKIAKGDAYKRAAAKRRHIRIRKRVSGTQERPRLVVTRSNLGIAILSTSGGLVTDRQAAKRGVGGEVLAYVW